MPSSTISSTGGKADWEAGTPIPYIHLNNPQISISYINNDWPDGGEICTGAFPNIDFDPVKTPESIDNGTNVLD